LIEDLWIIHILMATSYVYQEKLGEALASAKLASRLAPWNSLIGGMLAGIYSLMGSDEKAREVLANLQPTENMPVGMLFYHVLRSEIDTAAEWYEKAIGARAPYAVLLATHSFTAGLRASERWPALAKMMHLAEIDSATNSGGR
jgi:hypothetical protein